MRHFVTHTHTLTWPHKSNSSYTAAPLQTNHIPWNVRCKLPLVRWLPGGMAGMDRENTLIQPHLKEKPSLPCFPQSQTHIHIKNPSTWFLRPYCVLFSGFTKCIFNPCLFLQTGSSKYSNLCYMSVCFQGLLHVVPPKQLHQFLGRLCHLLSSGLHGWRTGRGHRHCGPIRWKEVFAWNQDCHEMQRT